MQRLEVSGAVRLIYGSLGVKGLIRRPENSSKPLPEVHTSQSAYCVYISLYISKYGFSLEVLTQKYQWSNILNVSKKSFHVRQMIALFQRKDIECKDKKVVAGTLINFALYRPGEKNCQVSLTFLQTTKALRDSRGIALLFSRTSVHQMGVGVSPTPRLPIPPGEKRYPFYRRLGGPQGRSGRAEILVPTGIQSRTVQLIVGPYTN